MNKKIAPEDIEAWRKFTSNKETIENLKRIEHHILHSAAMVRQNISYRVAEQLDNKYIKIFTEKHIDFGKNKSLNIVLKISGIWNNYTSCGLTFRFYIVNHLSNNE